MNGLGMREKLLPRMHRMAATGSARTSRFQVLLLLLAASFLLSPAQGQPIPAACPDTCSDALAYIVIPTQSQTPQTLGGIAANFHADVVALAAANDGDLEDVDNLGDTVVQANQTLRVPLAACSCKGESYSADGITYVVKALDSLSAIAELSYGGLVTYQAIAAASDISDPNVIQPGQVLTIPIPCSCVSSSASPPAVALSYKVVLADDYTVIGKKFNSTPASIESLNPTVNASTLQANQVIQVPLSACSFNLSTESLDSGLLVAHDAYAITADGCVQCTCSDDLQASCTPSPVVLPCSRTLTCPGTNLTIGSFSSQASGTACEITICQYAGYNKTSIITRVQQQSVTAARCSDLAEPPPPPAPPRPIGAPPPESPPFISPPVPRGTGPRSPPPPGGSSTTAAPPPSSASRTGARALVATWLPVLALLLV